MHNIVSRRDDVLAQIEDTKIYLFEILEDLWENAEESHDLIVEAKSEFRRLLKLRSELEDIR